MVAVDPSALEPKKWSVLREDLTLYTGARTAEGLPTWTLHDPVSHRYYRLGWLEFELLQRWGMENAEAIIASIEHDTPLHADLDDIEVFEEFLKLHQLVKPQGIEGSKLLERKYLMTRPKFWTTLLHNYLFFRIPLIRPNKLLNGLLPRLDWLFSRTFINSILILAILAVYLVTEQWALYAYSFAEVFTAEGMVTAAIMLSLSKVVHEFGHAITASRFGCRVPTMGVAFMMAVPMLWTDVTDAWRLSDKHQRLMIDAAGVIAELSLAVIATLIWTMLPDGTLRSGIYLLSSTVWLITLAVNFNPFMRFDGYYLLSDYLDIANLQDRSFELARWQLREILFHFHLPPPEIFKKQRYYFLVMYAYGVWIYRLILFAGIAWVIYHFFFKLLGLFLFAVEIGWFIVRPIIKEMLIWRDLLKQQNQPLRPRLAWLIPILLIAVLFIPWHTHLLVSGLLNAEQEFTLYSPQSAQIKQVLIKEGDDVKAEQTLIELTSPDLDYKITEAELKLTGIKNQLAAQSLDRTLAQHNPVDLQALQSTIAELEGLRAAQEKLIIKATLSGKIRDLSDVLQQGEWLAEDEPLAVIKNGNTSITAYVEEADLSRLDIGAEGLFYPEGGDLPPVNAKVITVDRVGTRQLIMAELASKYGGEIAVREDDQQHLVPEQSIYRVLLSVNQPINNHTTLRGRLSLDTPPESLIGRLWRSALAVLIRESGW